MTEIPEFSIARLELGPDDVVVFKCAERLVPSDRAMIEEVARKAFPLPRKILVLDGDIEISVLMEGNGP